MGRSEGGSEAGRAGGREERRDRRTKGWEEYAHRQNENERSHSLALSLCFLPGKLTVSTVYIRAITISDMEHQILSALRMK